MKLFNVVSGAILSSLMFCSTIASAAVIDFGSSANNPFGFNSRTFDNVVGDIDLTITAGVFSDRSSIITIAESGENNRRFGIENSEGLGVFGINDEDDNTQIDGQGRNDIVIFTFSEQVSFLGFDFGNIGSQDDLHFGLVDGDTFERTLTDVRITSSDFSLSSALVGTTFAVGAVERNDSFTLNSITVVPEPSTVFVLAIGLLGMGLRLRRTH